MKIKHAINDIQSMAHDGSKILKSLQNNYLPLIDIVVRESIQNSLDASLEGVKKTQVEFIINHFISENFAVFLEEVDQLLIERFPGRQRFIAIRDRNTHGLTGDYKSTDLKELNNSNFHKLVFSIGKNQTNDGAGGSWGYGKTSYFRLGAGIVIYYTRIQKGERFEERLIASIIEDPSKEDRLLLNNERGIAWWGEYAEDNGRIFPITDSQEIERILSVFGLKGYSGNETGTTVIIPYVRDIDEEKIIDDDALNFPWESSYEDAISMAVQRWYFPRINNEGYSRKFNKPYLECRVNKRLIHPNIEFEPVFYIYKELYTSALFGKPTMPNIKVEAINLGRNALKNTKEPVGYIAFREVSYEELKMTPPENKFPALAYLGIKDKGLIDQGAQKVIAYSRMPGMVVEYSVNGPWASGNAALKEDSILLGFFVPNSNAELTDNFNEAGYRTLESYLRGIEKSDHANWEDDVNVTIVKRIRERTNQTIIKAYQDDKDLTTSSATSSLSRKFGSILMPPKNFGRSSARKTEESKRTAKKSSTNKKRGSDVTVMRSVFKDEKTVEVAFRAFIKKKSFNTLLLQVLTQEQRMDYHSWINVMDDAVPFPFWITDFYISSINGKEINMSSNDYKYEEVVISMNKEHKTALQIESSLDEDGVIEGAIVLYIHSNQYIPNLAIRSV